MHRTLTVVGVVAYSALVGGLRWTGVIGDRGAFVLYGVMVLDLALTNWLLARRRDRSRDDS